MRTKYVISLDGDERVYDSDFSFVGHLLNVLNELYLNDVNFTKRVIGIELENNPIYDYELKVIITRL